MATPTPEGMRRAGTAESTSRTGGGARRVGTEAKAAYKTTELYIYLLAVLATLLASHLIGTTRGHGDYFRGDKAWFFIVLLTIGYLVSRGLAKAGSREPSDER